MNETAKVRRLTMEALDVAFYLCNNFTEKFGFSKIFDVMDQILPTAFVLNTAYWVYYNDVYGNKNCICGRYGIYCRHVRNGSHWINLKAVDDRVDDNNFVPAVHGKVFPKNYRVYVKANESYYGLNYDIVICLSMRNVHSTEEVLLGLNQVIPRQHAEFVIRARYGFQQEYYEGFFTKLTFNPNPVTLAIYGSYVDAKKKGAPPEVVGVNMALRQCDMPTYTMTLISANLPIYQRITQVNLYLKSLKKRSLTPQPASLNIFNPLGLPFPQNVYGNQALTEVADKAEDAPQECLSVLRPMSPEIINLTDEEGDVADIFKFKMKMKAFASKPNTARIFSQEEQALTSENCDFYGFSNVPHNFDKFATIDKQGQEDLCGLYPTMQDPKVDLLPCPWQ